MTNAKYPTLSFIARLLTLLGWLLVFVGSVATLFGGVVVVREQEPAGVLILCSGSAAVLVGLIGTGSGELARVIFDIEQNTRHSAEARRVAQ